jgi:hypothetical protein
MSFIPLFITSDGPENTMYIAMIQVSIAVLCRSSAELFKKCIPEART